MHKVEDFLSIAFTSHMNCMDRHKYLWLYLKIFIQHESTYSALIYNLQYRTKIFDLTITVASVKAGYKFRNLHFYLDKGLDWKTVWTENLPFI